MAQAQSNLVKMEYWIGNDPGFGLGIDIPVSNQQPDLNFIQSIAPNLSPGINYLGFRSKDANNVWSHTNFLTLNVIDSTQLKIVEIEYFWDTDSGFNTHSDTLFLNPVADISNGLLNGNVPLNLGPGTHLLYVRSKDSQGRWSHTNYVDSVVIMGTVDIKTFSNQTGVQAFPNPFTDHITIAPNNNEKIRVIIYDVAGKRMLDKVVLTNSDLDTQTLIPGIYSIFILTEKNKVYNFKMEKVSR